MDRRNYMAAEEIYGAGDDANQRPRARAVERISGRHRSESAGAGGSKCQATSL